MKIYRDFGIKVLVDPIRKLWNFTDLKLVDKSV